MVGTVARIVCLVLSFALAGEAATRKECKASLCRPQVTACKTACESLTKRRARARCRAKCKSTVTKACRADREPCGAIGGAPAPAGECKAYTPACPARPLLPLRERNATCTGASGAAQPCDYDFDTKFRVRTPWRTHAGECCVIDTCRGATAFGVYDNLAAPALGIPAGSSPLTAPVVITVQSLSSYFQRPRVGAGPPGQWGHHTATVFSIGCSTPPQARVISTAGGPLSAVDRGDFSSYDTRPVPPPSGDWDYLTLSADGTSVSLAPPRPPLLPECGSAPDTLTCQPRIFALDPILFIGDANPITETLSERISIDQLCDDAIVASAEGRFRRRDGSECSVTIYASAKIGCETDADCMAGEMCLPPNPASVASFETAFPGWSGNSCIIPTP